MNNNLDNLITVCHKCHIRLDFIRANRSFNKGDSREKRERNGEIISLTGKFTQADIAKMYNITRQRVHQIIWLC